jgi:opacity protein-like surface antigen
MTYRKLIVSAVLLALSVLPPAATAERDWGSSHNLLIKAPINDEWFVISRSNLASRNDFDDLFLGFTGGGLGFQWTDEWSLRAGYRHVWFKPQDDWREEDRLYAEAFFANRFDHVRFTSRSRLEFRFLDYRENDVRFRNEFVVESNKTIPGTALRPYAEEEFFYSTNDHRFEANWLGAGVAWRPADGVKLKIGYRWNRFRVGDDWRDRDTLVTGINLFF